MKPVLRDQNKWFRNNLSHIFHEINKIETTLVPIIISLSFIICLRLYYNFCTNNPEHKQP